MKLNKTSQHAIRILIYIAKQSSQKIFKSNEIAKQLDIPYKYLTSIMTQLSQANIIKSIRGREGGFVLSKEPALIKLIDILNAVKEYVNQNECILGIGLCKESKKCSLHDACRNPKQSMIKMLSNTTLENLIKN